MIRKTAKYYREALTKNPSEALLKEIVKKYGYDGYIRLNDIEYNWNHRIDGIALGNAGKLYFDIYWQGDSTDGNDYVLVSDVKGKSAYIPAVYEDLGYRTYIKHGDIYVVREEYDNAIKALIEYLSPKAIKARKRQDLISKTYSIIYEELFPEYKKKPWWSHDDYLKAREATVKHVKACADDLLKLSSAEFHDLIVETFKANG